MKLDARQLPDGAGLEADVCVIGSGPAGLVLARELSDTGVSVLLLESGGSTASEFGRDLNNGRVVGDRYAGLAATRHRQVGGTSCIWNTRVAGERGAKYVPLDPFDFSPGDGPEAGWPISRDDLVPFYRRAQAICGLGPFAYTAGEWSDPARLPFAFPDERLSSAVYQFGNGRLFSETYPAHLYGSSSAQVCLHATVLQLIPNGAGRRVVEARIGSQSGRTQVARARIFVLAAGAIENPRILLLSELKQPGDVVGRYFMEHPRDHALSLAPNAPDLYRRARFYDAHRAGDGTLIGGRLALSETMIRERQLPNASVTLLPRVPEPNRPTGLTGRILARIRQAATPGVPQGYGWSEQPDPAEVYDGFRVVVNFEQLPHPENRIVLGAERDSLGLPRPVLHLNWRPEEQADLERLRRLIASALQAGGVGPVQVQSGHPPDPSAHHHAGTTRMDRDERYGVVDADSRVHGVDNLYVAGASVFPRVGFANPTLTVVAMAARLADHLRSRG